MRRVVLLSSVVVTGWAFGGFGETGDALAQCVATTDCASLGYTESSCPNGGIKCPFGTTWSCKENYDSKNDDINCTYGSIYYNDGTCMKEFVSGRIPIGIVVYVDPVSNEKWIAALDSTSYSDWSSAYVDVSGITNFTTSLTVASDVKSCENTAAMIKEDEHSIGNKVKDYAPTGAENTKGQWCLPAAGVFSMIQEHLTVIDEALAKVSGLKFSVECGYALYSYWTSSEFSDNTAWYWNNRNGGALSKQSKNGYTSSGYSNARFCVRPVMKI